MLRVVFIHLPNCPRALTCQVSTFPLFLFPLSISPEFHTQMHISAVLRYHNCLTVFIVGILTSWLKKRFGVF